MWVFTALSRPPSTHCASSLGCCAAVCAKAVSPFSCDFSGPLPCAVTMRCCFISMFFFFSSVSQELKLSHFISFQWEDSWYDFSLLLSVMSCFMPCHVTHQSWGDFHMHLERMSTLLCGQSSLWVGNGGRCGYIVRAQGVFLLPKLFCILIELHIHTLEYTNNWWNRNSSGWTDGRGLYFGIGTILW